VTCGGWKPEDLRGATAVYADVADLLDRYDTSLLADLAQARSSA